MNNWIFFKTKDIHIRRANKLLISEDKMISIFFYLTRSKKKKKEDESLINQ